MTAAFGKSARKKIAVAITESDGLLGNADGTRIDLFKNNIVPDPSLEFADFEVADFPGYASTTSGLGEWDRSPDADGGESMFCNTLALFQSSTGFTTLQTVYGYMVSTLSTAPELIGAVAFPTPLDVALPLQTIGFIAALSMPQEIARTSPIDP